MPITAEAGMGGTPAISLINKRQTLKATEPLTRQAIAQHAVRIQPLKPGGITNAISTQGINQILLMVAAQPGRTTGFDEPPCQVHGRFDPISPTDQVTENDQVIPTRQNLQQSMK